MSKSRRYFTMPEVVRMLGLDYDRVRYAVVSSRIVEPARQFGKARLFTAEQVEQLRNHFAQKQHEAEVQPTEAIQP
jgi:hypothetical protein